MRCSTHPFVGKWTFFPFRNTYNAHGFGDTIIIVITIIFTIIIIIIIIIIFPFIIIIIIIITTTTIYYIAFRIIVFTTKFKFSISRYCLYGEPNGNKSLKVPH